MTESRPDDASPSLGDTVYRRAFPNEPDASFLAETRKAAIDARLDGRPDEPTVRSGLLKALQDLGFDRPMLAILGREMPAPALGLFLHHAQEFLAEGIGSGRGLPAQLAARPNWEDGFNRALDRTRRDLAAIDEAILAVTGKEPPRGRGR